MSRNTYWEGLEFSHCKILSPVDNTLITSKDKYNILCHCGKLFTCIPNSLQQRLTKSCGCINSQKARERGKSKRKYNYYNLITDNKIKIIKPFDEQKNGNRDLWIANCPICKNDFTGLAHDLLQYQSCGCLQRERARNNLKNFHIKNRKSQGLKDNQLLSKENNILRQLIFKPIQQFVLELDCYTCNLCLTKKDGELEVHHIISIKEDFDFTNRNSYLKIYDIDNLVTLCHDCHKELAHDGNTKSINLIIQNELKTIVSMRFVSKEMKIKQEQIIKQIEFNLLALMDKTYATSTN